MSLRISAVKGCLLLKIYRVWFPCVSIERLAAGNCLHIGNELSKGDGPGVRYKYLTTGICYANFAVLRCLKPVLERHTYVAYFTISTSRATSMYLSTVCCHTDFS